MITTQPPIQRPPEDVRFIPPKKDAAVASEDEHAFEYKTRKLSSKQKARLKKFLDNDVPEDQKEEVLGMFIRLSEAMRERHWSEKYHFDAYSYQ